MRLMKGFEARGEQGKRSKLSRSLTGLYPQEYEILIYFIREETQIKLRK